MRAEDAHSSLQGWRQPGRRCLAFSSWCMLRPAWEVFTQASSYCCLGREEGQCCEPQPRDRREGLPGPAEMEERVGAELLVQRSSPGSLRATADSLLSPLFPWSIRVSHKSLLCRHGLFLSLLRTVCAGAPPPSIPPSRGAPWAAGSPQTTHPAGGLPAVPDRECSPNVESGT